MGIFETGLFFGGLFMLFSSTIFTVRQQNVAVIETFGKYSRMAKAGLNFKLPFIENIAHKVSLRVQQLDVKVETKTSDNVFVHVLVSVQYYVLPDNVYDAAYRLNNPIEQIRAYVFDVVRARVPMIKLDDLYEMKNEIADAVESMLKIDMDDFGYGIQKALLTDIDPDPKVKEAMNEINAAQRMRVAANEKGEAEKILKVKSAEADAESKALSGKGIADQRKAIIEGLRNSVDEFQKSIPGTNAQDVMNLVLMTQYFDTLKELGMTGRTNTIMLPHSPGGMKDLMNQLRETMMSANAVNGAANN